MIQGNRLLYIPCERPGHGDNSLNQVCIDERCRRRGLLCTECVKIEHRDHRIMTLARFLDQQQSPNDEKLNADLESIKSLRQMKQKVHAQIAALQKEGTEAIADLYRLLTGCDVLE